ncbi:MAG: hypothetical protein JXA66_00380 [Oligoflexia bacterium]|nr:hypothetical protein [Oligoflexia bacterium]
MIKRAFYIFLFICSLGGFYLLSIHSVFNPFDDMSVFLDNTLNDLKIISDIGRQKTPQVKDNGILKIEKKADELREKFIQANYRFLEDVTRNSYRTLTSLSIKTSERFASGDNSAVLTRLGEMRNVVRDSGLSTDEKITLYKGIRGLEEIVNGIRETDREIALVKKQKTASGKAGVANITEEMSKSIQAKQSKLSELGSYKTFLAVFCFLFLIAGLAGIVYESGQVRRNYGKESAEIAKTLNSIMDGADSEVLIRLKRMQFFEEIKIALYETLRIFSGQMLFYRECLSDMDIPVFFKGDGNEYVNPAMDNLCAELGIYPDNMGEMFFYRDRLYTRSGDENIFCIFSADFFLLKDFVDQEISVLLESENISGIPENIRELYRKYKVLEHKKDGLLAKKNVAETRLRTVMDISREQKKNFLTRLSIVDDLLSRSRVALDSGLLLSSSVKNLGKKISSVHQYINESLRLSSRISEAKSATSDVLDHFPELSGLIEAVSALFYKIAREARLDLISGLPVEETTKAEHRIERIKMLIDEIDIALEKFSAMHDNFNMDEMHDLVEDLTISYKTVFNNADRVNSGLEELSGLDSAVTVEEGTPKQEVNA